MPASCRSGYSKMRKIDPSHHPKSKSLIYNEEFGVLREIRLLVQFVEQRLGFLQVGGVEALGEPVVDFGEHRARLAALALFCEQPRQAHRCAQLQYLRAL